MPVETVIEPLTLDSVKSEFQDAFEGLGRFPDPYKISTKPEVEPVIQPPRSIPMNLHARLRGKLDEMERDGIIAKVDSPTDWVQWNLDLTKSLRTSQICLLNRGFVISKTSI